MNKLYFLCLIMAVYTMALSSRNKVKSKSKSKVVLKMREGSLEKKVLSIITQKNKETKLPKNQSEDFKKQ